MLKKVFLMILIPLPLMALLIGAVVVFEFQKLQSSGATQLSALSFVQQKVMRLIDMQELGIPLPSSNDSIPAPKPITEAAAKPIGATVAAPKPAAAAEVAPELKKQAELQRDQGVADPDKSFGERLSGLFSSNEEEVKKPRRMVCKKTRGYKRCRFPKED
ncbi:MAG: hypothetical protein AAGA08_06630 [Pseudomonadota bacterium]